MKKTKSIINKIGRNVGNTYFVLHLSASLSYLLKKHCNYATFTFRYKSVDLAKSDYEQILNELIANGVSTSQFTLSIDI